MTDLNYLESIYSSLPDTNFSLIISIFSLVMYWMLLEKAGENGWKILIPYYSEYTIFKIAKKRNLFWWQLVIGIVTVISAITLLTMSIFMIEAESEMSGLVTGCIINSVLIFILSIVLFVIKVKRSIGLSKAFGQSTAFGVGILFIEPVFIAIIALNTNIQYVQGQSMLNDENAIFYENEF